MVAIKILKYENGNPMAEFEISGKENFIKLKGYLDTGATNIIVPRRVKEEAGLTWLGSTAVLTVGGIIPENVYLGKVKFMGKEFKVTIICRDLPEKESLIGREILDNFEVCFQGPRRKLKISE